MATRIENVKYKKVPEEGKPSERDLEESLTTSSNNSESASFIAYLNETPMRKRSRKISDYGALNTTNLTVLFDENNDCADQGGKTPTNLLEEKKYVDKYTQTNERCNESLQLLNNSRITNLINRKDKNTNCAESNNSFNDLLFLSPPLSKRVASTPLIALKVGSSIEAIEGVMLRLCTPKVDLNINDASKSKDINKDTNIRLHMNNVTNTQHQPAAVMSVMSCLTSCAPLQILRSKLKDICVNIKGKLRSKLQEFLRDEHQDSNKDNTPNQPKCVAECLEIMRDLKVLLERLSKLEYEKLQSKPGVEERQDESSLLSSVPPPPSPPPPPPPPPPPLPSLPLTPSLPKFPKSSLRRSQSLNESSESKSEKPRIALEDILNVKLRKVSDRCHISRKRFSQPSITKDMLEQVQLKPPRRKKYLTPDMKENLSMSPQSSLCRTLLSKSEGGVKRLQNKVRRVDSSYKRSLLTKRDDS